MILLATNSRDLTCDYVALELRRRALPFVRLNTEEIPAGTVTFDPRLGENAWCLSINDQSIDFQQIRGAYFRRPEPPVANLNIADEAERDYANREWLEVLSSALNSIDKHWLNSPAAIHLAENKPRQLALAYSLGFQIPETKITNDPSVVSTFLSDGPAIVKPIRSGLVSYANEERVIFTNQLATLPASNESIRAAPFIIQREIKKRADIRVTVVGKNAFAASIDSQAIEETKTDWRKGEHSELKHSTHVLPSTVSDQCVSITQKMGLKFSAIDLILDLVGEYWFLEINPNGQWAWIENRTGLPITKSIVDELCGNE